MQIEITSKRAGMLCAFGLVLTLSGGVAWARGEASPPPQANSAQVSGVIVACAKTATGSMRLSTPGAKCGVGETLVSWNQAGPAGPAGTPGVSGYEVVESTSDLNQAPAARAFCPAGKRLLGGGFKGLVQIGSVVESRPEGLASQRPDWSVYAFTATGQMRVTSYATCAFVSS
jgi:hypothetical protein